MFQEIEDFKIKIIVNMTKSVEDEKVGEIIKTVADKFLGITVDVLKPIAFDKKAEESIVLTNPLLLHENGNSISMATYEIASALLKA
jgi:MinD-like ATPase involved in chromosome partitioning or flagellar assembly